MSEPAFQQFQRALTAHIRDPKHVERPPGTRKSQVSIYDELLHHKFEGFLLACFPVLRKILRKKRWGKLVRAFFREHRCQSPLFRDIPAEFLAYVSARGCTALKLPDFTLELAHYEWLELHLDIDEQQVHAPRLSQAPLDKVLRINPVLDLVAYRYPVHRLARDYQPESPPDQPTFLCVWRNSSDRIQCMELSAVAAELLETLRQGQPAQPLLQQFGAGDARLTAEFLEQGAELLREWLEAEIIVGVKRGKPHGVPSTQEVD